MKSFKTHSSIIGFSGKLNAGKDFSAKLCQALITQAQKERDVDIANFVNAPKEIREELSGFKTKAFADKLKQMCSIATGTSLDGWYNRELKEATLPAPFNKYSRRTFMTTFAQALSEIDKDFFPKTLFAEYATTSGTLGLFDDIPSEEFGENWIITDVRYPNEAEIVTAKKGLLIRVERPLSDRHPGYEALEDIKKDDALVYKKLMHSSETALDNYDFDYVVKWEDDPITLLEQLEVILEKNGYI